MSHTFEVRFAHSAGLAAALAAPANTLRWKGSGRISINSESVTIAAKRGVLSFFVRDRSRRISAAQLREVYREGAALRLEFTGAGNAREVVPLWANDREAAARIVQLMPTTRTVEVEHVTDQGPPKFRPDARALGVLLIAAVVAAAGVLAVQRTRLASERVTVPTGPAAIPSGESTPELAPVEIPPAQLPIRIDDPVVPIPEGSRAYETARAQLTIFTAESAALLDEYRLYRTMLEADALTTEGFIAKLEGPIENGWWKVTFRILEEPQFEDPALLGLRATQLAAARNWRAFLELYIEGLRRNDGTLIARAFAILARAEQLQLRALRYVR